MFELIDQPWSWSHELNRRTKNEPATDLAQRCHARAQHNGDAA